MRVIILAYDGLEYDLVEKFNLENLKQKEYGKTDISDFKVTSTPILWGSFLTGERITKYLKRDLIKNRVISFIYYSLEELRRRLKLDRTSLGDIITNVIQKVDSYRSNFWKLNIPVETTFLSSFNKVEIIDVPLLNNKSEKVYELAEVLNERISEREWEQRIWKQYQRKKKKLLHSLNNKNDLLMIWICISDVFGHLFRGDLSKMFEVYQELDELTKEVKLNAPEDTWILIVSDHGMRRLGERYGDHSKMNYGFYSSNIVLKLNRPKITDFYNIIRRISKNEI